jgi:hypothetical protein
MIIFVSMGCAFIAWARNLSVWFPKKYAEMYKLGQSEDLPVIVVKIIGVLFIAIGFFGLFCPIGIPANR